MPRRRSRHCRLPPQLAEGPLAPSLVGPTASFNAVIRGAFLKLKSDQFCLLLTRLFYTLSLPLSPTPFFSPLAALSLPLLLHKVEYPN